MVIGCFQWTFFQFNTYKFCSVIWSQKNEWPNKFFNQYAVWKLLLKFTNQMRTRTILTKNFLEVSAMSKSLDIISSSFIGAWPFADIFFFFNQSNFWTSFHFVSKKKVWRFSKIFSYMPHLLHLCCRKIISSFALLSWHNADRLTFTSRFILMYIFRRLDLFMIFLFILLSLKGTWFAITYLFRKVHVFQASRQVSLNISTDSVSKLYLTWKNLH